MADETNGKATPADTKAGSQAGQDDAKKTDLVEEDDDDSEPQAGSKTVSIGDHKKVQSEAKNLRKRLAEAEAKLKEEADKGLSELDRLKQENERLKGDLSKQQQTQLQRDRRDGVIRQLGDKRRGVTNAEAVYALMREVLEFEADSKQPSNFEDAYKEAQRLAPQLFTTNPNGSADAGRGGKPATGGDMNAWLRQAAK